MGLKLLICIDDTDNLESRGTGSIASEIKEIIENEYKNPQTSFITRHQLLLHKDIEYTSHNSSMAFECTVDALDYDRIEERITHYVRDESADGSDPGIAILKIDKISNQEKIELIDYGFACKNIVLNKQLAYDKAGKYNIYLKELGGDGTGVIGALAGIGLRLSKNDGEIKGCVGKFEKDKVYKIKDLLEHKDIDEVVSLDDQQPKEDDRVKISWRVKQIIRNGKRSVLVKREGDLWTSMIKKDLRNIDKEKSNLEVCEDYALDVSEELFDTSDSCLNCKYRRWEALNFKCMRGKKRWKNK